MTGSHTGIAKVSVVTAIKMTVLLSSGAEYYRRVSTAMMRLPATSPRVSTAAIPNKLLTATLAATIGPDPGLFYLFIGKLVIVWHVLKTRFVSNNP
jgi:hypothetical protein